MDSLKFTDLIQFVLEIVAFVSVGYWGWTQHEGIVRVLTAFGLPVVVAAVWGIFRVPNDPGKATVVIPAKLRLVLEIAVFALAVWCLYAAGQRNPAIALAVIVIVQYVISGRFVFLLTHKSVGVHPTNPDH